MRLDGFNFQWLLADRPELITPPDDRALDFVALCDFNFVRLPMSYKSWTNGVDYRHPQESVLRRVDAAVAACRSRGLHVSLNLHRAPGYCINRNDLETHNLWLDDVAQDGFVFLWESFAQRFLGVAATELSFDLVNEPPALGLYGMTRENHAAIIARTVRAIRAIDPQRPITIDGLDGGNVAMPELAGLGVTHSGRGYQPYPVSHWGAEWWQGWRDGDGPGYPGGVYGGKRWDKDQLRDFYEPWRDAERLGAAIHIGEFGCYNRTPNEDAMRWFRDLFELYGEYGWGYAMWNFEGPFGIIGHGRAGARFEDWNGYPVDRELLDLMMQTRTG